MVTAADYEPTPEEIAEGCAKIRATWSADELQRRSIHFAEGQNRAKPGNWQPQAWQPPTIRTAELADALAG